MKLIILECCLGMVTCSRELRNAALTFSEVKLSFLSSFYFIAVELGATSWFLRKLTDLENSFGYASLEFQISELER